LTHAHYDHVGGLPEVARLSPGAAIWIGGADLPDVPSLAGLRLRPVEDQDRIRQFQILHTPGHTPGHLSLLQEDSSVLLLGDLAAMMNGQLVRAPAVFTADPALCERSLRRAADLDPRRILPSHGPELPTPPARVLIDLLDPLPTTAQD
jgi:glyoxylase-like metal-dependent hydrolase (beta-lactamase superfamily II)